ncbi:serine hydrolase domain-containing protein [Anaerosacchariphilus polymeriproducens]|uniref:Class A beta-lactamase-related serine hydrolase n=1 Tax=Anaerosacchariphilus polymeriproducens TaxID=1812858 RepID=A0A371AYI3_9FIRM|nr:serine hydrolase domain-containing protein [Anaerosacchariphilus polymeriproducens]RDU24655.1 class A beta-lactamase-related serine hydrolase [Anaerosacchariphilus polymeriproducens]
MQIKKIMCFILLIFIIFSLSQKSIVYAETSEESVDTFERMTDDYMKKVLEEYHVAGVAVSIVKNGQVFFEKGYGYSDIKKKIPVDPHTTVFQIASVSKLFTATAAMQLVEQGKLSLDEDVNNYLTAFKLNNPFSKPVTLRNLLTHTAGLDDRVPLYLKSSGDILYDSLEPLEKELKKNMPPVIRKPGTFCQYNVYGMALVGHLVEEVSGKSINDYITEHILKPLHMKNSSYGLNSSIFKNMTKPYKYKDGKYIENSYTVISDHPSGSICATASDMAAFILMHLNNGEYNGIRVLNKSTVNNMHRNHYPNDGRLTGYGLGFYETVRNGKRTIEHGGYLPSFSSKLSILPDENIGMFISINTDSEGSNKVCNEFVDKFYEFFTEKGKDVEPEKLLKQNIPMDMNVKRINGRYVFGSYGQTDKTKLKSLLITCNVQCDKAGNLMFNGGQLKCKFKYIGKGYFYSKESGNYCKIAEKNNRMVFSFMGSDYEKLSGFNHNLMIAAIVFIPLLLLSIILLPIFMIRNRKEQTGKSLIFKSILLLLSILILTYYGLNGIMAIKCMAADTLIVHTYIIPLISVVCYFSFGLTVVSVIVIVNGWLKKKYLLRLRLYYSIITVASIINLLFMYVMNGFKL